MSVTVGIIYSIILFILFTWAIGFVVRRFLQEDELKGAIRVTIKSGLLLYPLAFGTLFITTAGHAWLPRVFWKAYVFLAFCWIVWSLFNPKLSSVRQSLSQQFEEHKGLFILLLTVSVLMVLPGLVTLIAYAF